MDYEILTGNVLEEIKKIADKSVQCCVTSPPYYGLRDYSTGVWIGGDTECTHKRDSKQSKTTITGQANLEGAIGDGICKRCGAKRIDEQIGLEETPELYIQKLTLVFREVHRAMADDGTLWVNIGDSYAANRSYQVGQTVQGDTTTEDKRYKGKGSKVPSGMKQKDLIGIPWMLAFALRADGWYLRSDIIWNKPNPMPESVKDRPTKSHEYIFLLTKSEKYYYDYKAILEVANYDGRKEIAMKGSSKYADGFSPTENMKANTLHTKGHARWSNKIQGRTERKMKGTGYGGDGMGLHGHSGYFDEDGKVRVHQFEDGVFARNKRSVWEVATKPYADAHFATYPPDLIEPCILAGSRKGDTVLDPFSGSATTGEVALTHHRKYIGIELNPDYVKLSHKRLSKVNPVLFPIERINT